MFKLNLYLFNCRYDIRVNAVLPTCINTPILKTVPKEVIETFIKEKHIMQRMGKPVEVAELILFLASKKSSFINGTLLEITGGYH
jgi:NAD(P)-dependent dehydrogenase (short-subunit alcohol dehydrogenase family)